MVNNPAHLAAMLSGEQYTERFGLVRLWHPQCDYLFAVILENGQLGWGSIYFELTKEQRAKELVWGRTSSTAKIISVTEEVQKLLSSGELRAIKPSPFVADCRAIEEWGRASSEAMLKGQPVPMLVLPSKAAA